jgi:membrane protein required for colicin V production
MNGADYLFVGILLVSLTLGTVRGFVREAISLLVWLAGLWLAWRYAYLLHPYLGGALATPGLREWVARVLLLVLILLAGSFVGWFAAYLMHRASGLAMTDRLLGLLFGLVRALVVVGVFVMVGQGLDLDGENWWKSSRLMPYAEHAARWLERYAEPTVEPLLEEAADLIRGT